eukprot:3368946-Amphidinium_carterae.1
MMRRIPVALGFAHSFLNCSANLEAAHDNELRLDNLLQHVDISWMVQPCAHQCATGTVNRFSKTCSAN